MERIKAIRNDKEDIIRVGWGIYEDTSARCLLCHQCQVLLRDPGIYLSFCTVSIKALDNHQTFSTVTFANQ